MADLIYLIMVASVPFGIGVATGVEIVNRRKPSLDTRLGGLIRDRIEQIADRGKWLETGSGFQVSNTMTLQISNGRKIDIIVREIA